MRRTGVLIAAGLLLTALVGGALLADDEKEALAPPYVAGELAYTETLNFDYDRDGTPEKVQFWIRFEGKPAFGSPGKAWYRPESGYILYFVYDMETKKKIENWGMGFNMGFPVVAEKPFPITDIDVTGKTASFVLQGTTWTIEDQGDTFEDDSITIVDPRGTRGGRFYGGDVQVVPDPLSMADPLDIPANQGCNECHHEAAVTIAVDGGPHRRLKCSACHVEHPPDVEHQVYPDCLSCHERHSVTMSGESCTTCHATHDAKAVQHNVRIPDDYCAACHQDSAAELEASGTLHTGLKCVLCHPNEHGESLGCTYCHKGTHPEHVMRKPEGCWKCHNTAHDTQSGHQ